MQGRTVELRRRLKLLELTGKRSFFVFAISADSALWVSGLKERAASNAWSKVFRSGHPLITTDVGRFSA